MSERYHFELMCTFRLWRHEICTSGPGLQAIEAGRNEEARNACVRKGLKVAATDAAKAKLVRRDCTRNA